MKMKKLQNMLEQAKVMQEQMEAEMKAMRVEASSGGGMVTVVMDGGKQVHSVTIDPAVVDPEDVEILQDMVMAAFNDAANQVDENAKEKVGGLAGGLLG